jgi:hypothetical protein
MNISYGNSKSISIAKPLTGFKIKLSVKQVVHNGQVRRIVKFKRGHYMDELNSSHGSLKKSLNASNLLHHFNNSHETFSQIEGPSKTTSDRQIVKFINLIIPEKITQLNTIINFVEGIMFNLSDFKDLSSS